MSLAFYVNNAHFALELLGAVVFLMAAWLMFDSYRLRAEFATIARAIGFGFAAIAQVLFAVNAGSDILAYAAFAFFFLGLFLIMVSFVKREEMHVQAVIIVPAFTLWSQYLYGSTGLLALGVAYLSLSKAHKELNTTWRPFSLGFSFLALSLLIGIFDTGDQESLIFIAKDIAQFLGFALVARWVWQFLELRVRESLVLIFIAAALFLSTIVTLAFSTILVHQVTSQTDAALVANARVLDLQVRGLQEQALAKAALIANNDALTDAIEKNDFAVLEQLSAIMMEEHTLGFLTVTDALGNVLVRAHALSRRGDTLFGERAVEEALDGATFVTIETSPVEKLSIRAGAPVRAAGAVIGTVVAGYPLDNAFVDNIKRLTGLDMFIYEEATSVAGTAFASDGRTRLTGIIVPDETVRSVGEERVITVRTDLGSQSFRTSYLPLLNGDRKIIGMLSAAKSEQDILDIENATNRLTLITVILIMLVLAYPIYSFTRRLTQEA
ncbi:MAG: hypothetical protein A2854_00520 [Parcubacteria group bacterium RIFCSPHIGHO2_01_FULL_56_18]|nr:MAG: hypothetical protein A2854_00520 [Parcubacteria group bacterium RIFCSPHIGHO2_01_FULL_56_18]